MKKSKLLITLVSISVVISVNFISDNNLILSYKKIDANQVSTYFRNTGMFNRNFETGNPGFEWGAGSGRYCRYSSNIVIGAVVGNDTLVSSEGDFEPGFIDNNGNPQGRDDPAYRVYKIVNGDMTDEDYNQWPANQGAYINSNGKPYLIGEQTLFSSYTDGYTNVNSLTNIPMKAQVLETDWAFNLNGPLGQCIFSEFRIINRSTNVWNNFYAGIFTDDDMGSAEDDMVAPDSSIHMGYTYNSTNNDGTIGAAPPAVSFNVLSGTDLFTGNTNDSVVIYRPVTSNNRYVKRGYRNLYLTSFNPFLNSNPVINTPTNDREYYNVLQGLKRDGSIWTIPSTNFQTRFPDENFGAGDFRFLISSGPAIVNPGDTQTIIVAQLVARGSNNLASVYALKAGAVIIRNIYENNFGTVSVNDPGVTNIPESFKLYQNFPNPFNPMTKIKFNLSKSGDVKLIVYDINGKEIANLFSGFMNAGDKEVSFDGSGIASGIYFYKLTAGNFSDTKKMILNK